MKIEVWGDFVCPFCYVGTVRLNKVLDKMKLDNVEVVYHSYQLDPSFKGEKAGSVVAYLSEKYGISKDEAEQRIKAVADHFEAEGIVYDYNTAITTNTQKAHKYANYFSLNKPESEKDFRLALYKAHFTDGKNINENAVLNQIAEQFGVNAKEVEEFVASTDSEQELYESGLLSREYGIRGVPFFVINQKYGISGAQPKEHFVQVIQTALED